MGLVSKMSSYAFSATGRIFSKLNNRFCMFKVYILAKTIW